MGEARKDALSLDVDRKLKLEFHGTKVTSDAGLLAHRELDSALGLTSIGDSEPCDIRTGKNMQHHLAALLRQTFYNRLAGYDDANDAERLAVDPAMRHIVGGRAVERSAASTSVMSRFEDRTYLQNRLPWDLIWDRTRPDPRLRSLPRGSSVTPDHTSGKPLGLSLRMGRPCVIIDADRCIDRGFFSLLPFL